MVVRERSSPMIQGCLHDRDDITPIKSNSTDIEDTSDSSVGTESNQVDEDAEEDGDPYGIKRSSGEAVDLSPDMRCWEKTITGEGEDSSSQWLHGCEAHELNYDEATDGEKDAPRLSETIVVDLRNWLS